MKHRNRCGGRSLRRDGRSSKEPNKRILILCEGKNTEPHYFLTLVKSKRTTTIELEVDPNRGVPTTLVKRAIERKKLSDRRGGDPRDKFDQIWCVFDVDEHPNLSETLQLAKANEICVALSNPCFEIWVLWHFQDHTRYDHRDDILQHCKGHIPNYNKKVSYDALKDRYEDALRRAKNVEAKHQGDGNEITANPSTSVYKLTERLLKGSWDEQCYE